MSDLAATFTSLGLDDVQTYIQSGNVVFSTTKMKASTIGERVERELKSRTGLDVTVFIRTSDEMEKIVAANPFAEKERSRLHVTFLQTRPAGMATDKMDSLRGEGEEFSISDREVFLFLPNGQGRTKLSNNFIEKAFNLKATTRNWNTVTTLSEMAQKVSRKR